MLRKRARRSRQRARRFRRSAGALALAGAVSGGSATGVYAQGATFTFVGEAAGDDVSLVLGDADFAFGAAQLRPVVALQGYGVIMDDATTAGTVWAITPFLGLRYAIPTGFLQGKVGYSWTDAEDGEGTPYFGGGESGVVTSIHGEHWGDGRLGLQGIASHNWGAEYLWTRARAAFRVLPSSSGSIHAGVEGGWQGHTRSEEAADPRSSTLRVGPVFQWITPYVLGTLGGGWKQSSGGLPEEDASTWYASVELTLIPW